MPIQHRICNWCYRHHLVDTACEPKHGLKRWFISKKENIKLCPPCALTVLQRCLHNTRNY